MKSIQKAWILGTALACAVSPVIARAQDASSSAPAESAPTKNIQLVGALASLNKSIDAKKMKQGDAVTAKLQSDVKIPDSMDLPKNTVLLGHVDQVQASENKSDSSIQVTFDKAQLKNGQQLDVKATIMQIAPPVNALTNNQQTGGGPSAMPSSPSPSPGGGGASPGGSGGGGGMQSSPRPSPSMGASAPDASQAAAQQQGVPGIQLQSDIHQSNSAVFTAKKKNVHLDDGTQLQMAIAVIPPNTQLK